MLDIGVNLVCRLLNNLNQSVGKNWNEFSQHAVMNLFVNVFDIKQIVHGIRLPDKTHHCICYWSVAPFTNMDYL